MSMTMSQLSPASPSLPKSFESFPQRLQRHILMPRTARHDPPVLPLSPPLRPSLPILLSRPPSPSSSPTFHQLSVFVSFQLFSAFSFRQLSAFPSVSFPSFSACELSHRSAFPAIQLSQPSQLSAFPAFPAFSFLSFPSFQLSPAFHSFLQLSLFLRTLPFPSVGPPGGSSSPRLDAPRTSGQHAFLPAVPAFPSSPTLS